MVLSGSSVKFLVVYKRSPSCHSSCRNQFVLLICYDSESSLLWNHMYPHPRTVEIANLKPAFSHFSTSFLTTSFITGFSLL